MAKVTPPQEIPSELLDGYRAALGEKRPDDGVRKRYPYRVPPMQTLVGHPTTKQKTQRDKFNLAIERFNATPGADRQRWYAAMPPWESFLWYYDYFILSALMYDANVKDGGAGVIKTIQVVKEEVPTTGEKSFVISTVDPAKTVVMVYGSSRKVPRVLRGSGSIATGGSTLALGATVDPAKCTVKLLGNSYISDTVQRGASTIADGGTNNHALSPNVNPAISEVIIHGEGGRMEIGDGEGTGVWATPYAFALIAAQLTVKMIDTLPNFTAGYSWEVIEHKAQIIHPYVSSLSTTQIGINWPLTPSIAAIIGWEVTEHVEGTVWPVLVSIAAEAVVIDWAEEPNAAADVSIIAIEYI